MILQEYFGLECIYKNLDYVNLNCQHPKWQCWFISHGGQHGLDFWLQMLAICGFASNLKFAVKVNRTELAAHSNGLYVPLPLFYYSIMIKSHDYIMIVKK